MQERPEDLPDTGVSTKCTNCGEDAGGIIWEGVMLRAILTIDDLLRLLRGFDRRTLVSYFRKGHLHGVRAGRSYVIRASQFVADWERFEQLGRVPAGRRRARKSRVIDVVAS